jgi:soluble lytic murein transglycosylase
MKIRGRQTGWAARTLGLLTILCLLVARTEAALESQRAQFLAAEEALAQGRYQDFEQLSAALKDYPLYPYLDYERLSGELGKASPARVRKFLQAYKDTPLAERLRRQWLDRLAEDKRWDTYLQFYVPSDRKDARCEQLHALIATGHASQAYAQVPDLWLHGRSMPKECDPVFAAWRAAGKLTPELTWRRIALAFQSNESRLVTYLKRFLHGADQGFADLWLKVHREPQLLEHSPDLLGRQHPWRIAALEDGLKGLARQDPDGALGAWKGLKGHFAFSEEQSDRITRGLVLQLARQEPAKAMGYLESIAAPDADDPKFGETRIRTALELENWDKALEWIDALGPEGRTSECWRYWRARALEQLGREKEAEPIYRALSAERSYYGFLAADRLGLAYQLDDVPVSVSATAAADVRNKPSILRAHELLTLDRLTDARREWNWATAHMSAEELQAAAKLAQSWGWNDRAIFTLARAGYWDDLALRFPLEHRRLVEEQAHKTGLDPAWVYAVVRQESAFVRDARSGAGALGLMQLMPETAKHLARKLGEHPPAKQALLDPRTNIRLGSRYLSRVLGELGDNPVLATAAYNAGPGRVRSWLPETALDADLWVEMIPFQETRRYVQHVLAYTVIYEQRLGATPTRLNVRMRPVSGSSAWAAGKKDEGKDRA